MDLARWVGDGTRYAGRAHAFRPPPAGAGRGGGEGAHGRRGTRRRAPEPIVPGGAGVKYPFRWIALVAAAGAAVLGVVLALNVGSDPRADAEVSALLGKPAPEWRVTLLDGTEVSSESLVGKTVLVNFWNSWCIPCREELPVLQQWYARHADDPDVVLVGIPRDDTVGAIRRAAREDEMGWAARQDADAEAATLAFGTRGQPETYAIGPDGVIVGSLYGPVTMKVLDQMVARAQGVG
ncbi:MAG: TlpA family protein disulfide reductase [Actinobacteria bacterium]|nr:TlpA family protein disulfide reductase [Actinomycetota bacterium]